MIREASLEPAGAGLVPTGEGWFVVSARDGRWTHAEGRGARLAFEGEPKFLQVGISLFALPCRLPTVQRPGCLIESFNSLSGGRRTR